MGQEGGEAKIGSGWPPGFDAISRRSLTPGRSMSVHSVQPSVPQHLAATTPSRRRSVPPSLPEPVSQSLNQRWRERPRCPASPVAPDRRDGVVHAIVGRASCRRLCAHRSCGTNAPPACTCSSPNSPERTGRGFVQKSVRACARVPGRNVCSCSRILPSTIAFFMLVPCSASSMLFAALRPGRRPGLWALTTPPRGTHLALARWWSACRSLGRS